MKKLLLLFITTSFVLSQNLIWSVDEKYENGTIKQISYHQKIWKKIELVKIETYHENGQIWLEGNYKDGKEDGKWTLYYENGQIWIEGNYKDGEKNGKWTSYNENGQMMLEGNTKDGKSVGKWTYYNEDGNINKVEEWKDGQLIEK